MITLSHSVLYRELSISFHETCECVFHVNCTAGHGAVARSFHKFKHAPVLNAEEAVFALEADGHSAVARAGKDTDCFAEYCEGVDYKGPPLNDVRQNFLSFSFSSSFGFSRVRGGDTDRQTSFGPASIIF